MFGIVALPTAQLPPASSFKQTGLLYAPKKRTHTQNPQTTSNTNKRKQAESSLRPPPAFCPPSRDPEEPRGCSPGKAGACAGSRGSPAPLLPATGAGMSSANNALTIRVFILCASRPPVLPLPARLGMAGKPQTWLGQGSAAVAGIRGELHPDGPSEPARAGSSAAPPASASAPASSCRRSSGLRAGGS